MQDVKWELKWIGVRGWGMGVLGGRGGGGGIQTTAKHRCKATTAAAVDGQTTGPLFPRTHTHTKCSKCVPGQHMWEQAGSSVSLISAIARCFHPLQMTDTHQTQHLSLLIQLRSRPGIKEWFYVVNQIYCYLIRPMANRNTGIKKQVHGTSGNICRWIANKQWKFGLAWAVHS